jgi:O-antigen/teichoic acid export membrane protein
VLRCDFSAVKDLLKGGTKLHMNAIGTYLFSQANILILNNYRSPSETAYYQLAMQLVNAMQMIPMAVSTVSYSLVAQEGPDAAWPQHRKLLGEVLLVVAFLAGIAYFVAPFIVPLIFGKAFAASVPLFRVLLFAVAGMTMSTVMACQWISRGLFLHAALLTIFVGGITVLANFLVVPRYGMVGAAWVTVGIYGVSIVGNGIMALWVQSRWRRYNERIAYA